jgi:transcriptional regulator with XRE-family HTH domain
MGKIIRLSHYARASSGSRPPTKSFAVRAPPATSTMRSTSPRDGTWRRVSIRDKEALETPTRDASSSRLIPASLRYDLNGWLLIPLCYTECNDAVKSFVAPYATTTELNHASIVPMAKRLQGQHYIRQWREKRGISLRKLAARLEVELDGEELLSYASLSRIENGKQPFSEPVLNAIADALDVTRSMLLEKDPKKEGHALDLLNKMTPANREQAIRMLELFAQSAAA